MAKADDIELPEVFASTKELSKKVSRWVKEGRIRKIGPKLYTTNLDADPAVLIKRNLWAVVAALFPGAVICFRTAFEGKPSSDGSLFLSGTSNRLVKLPGVTVRQVRAPGHQPGDMPFVGGLYMSSRARQYLENLVQTKGRGMVPRSVGRASIEAGLAKILSLNGEDTLNEIRDKARQIAPALGLDEEFQVLDKTIGALLRSRESDELTAPSAIAIAHGEPYDPARLEVFDALRSALAVRVPINRGDEVRSGAAFNNIAFFDAYFSNYIEGTEFEIDEALGIVFDNQIPKSRPDDAHDVLGTWKVVSSVEQMSRVPDDFDEFLTVLRRVHFVIMEGRPSLDPGRFKEKPNRAGNTQFVHPRQVLGTLRKGFEFYTSLDDPFARALYMKFMIAEVHPFQDGNGRTARAMMNAELVARKQRRIIIPSVFRNEYLGSLKRLTRQKDPASYLRVMDYAQEFSHHINFVDLTEARRLLESCNAFKDPSDKAKLKMPPKVDPSIR